MSGRSRKAAPVLEEPLVGTVGPLELLELLRLFGTNMVVTVTPVVDAPLVDDGGAVIVVDVVKGVAEEVGVGLPPSGEEVVLLLAVALDVVEVDEEEVKEVLKSGLLIENSGEAFPESPSKTTM